MTSRRSFLCTAAGLAGLPLVGAKVEHEFVFLPPHPPDTAMQETLDYLYQMLMHGQAVVPKHMEHLFEGKV